MEAIGGPEVCMSLMGTLFSGVDTLPKVRWIAKNEPELFAKMKCFLDCNGYLTYRATGEMVFDIATASFLGYDRESASAISDLIAISGFDPDMQLWVYSTETCCATFNWFIYNYLHSRKGQPSDPQIAGAIGGGFAAAIGLGMYQSYDAVKDLYHRWNRKAG